MLSEYEVIKNALLRIGCDIEYGGNKHDDVDNQEITILMKYQEDIDLRFDHGKLVEVWGA